MAGTVSNSDTIDPELGITRSDFHLLFNSPRAALMLGHFPDAQTTLETTDALITTFEKWSTPTHGSIPTILSDLAVVSSERSYFSADVLNRAKRAIALLEKWGCEAELINIINRVYLYGKTFSVHEGFVDVVQGLVNIAEKNLVENKTGADKFTVKYSKNMLTTKPEVLPVETIIKLLARIQQEAAYDMGYFSEIGLMFECTPNKKSFETAQNNWNRANPNATVNITLPKDNFDSFGEKEMKLERCYAHLKINDKHSEYNKARFYTLEGHQIRADLHTIFKNISVDLKRKLLLADIDVKSMPPSSLRHIVSEKTKQPHQSIIPKQLTKN